MEKMKVEDTPVLANIVERVNPAPQSAKKQDLGDDTDDEDDEDAENEEDDAEDVDEEDLDDEDPDDEDLDDLDEEEDDADDPDPDDEEIDDLGDDEEDEPDEEDTTPGEEGVESRMNPEVYERTVVRPIAEEIVAEMGKCIDAKLVAVESKDGQGKFLVEVTLPRGVKRPMGLRKL